MTNIKPRTQHTRPENSSSAREEIFATQCEKLHERGILEPLDAIAVAMVMKWLGTSVGFDFLEETLKKAGYAVTPTKFRTRR